MVNEAWVLRSDGEVWENGRLLGKVDSIPQEGDSIVSYFLVILTNYRFQTITFDHVDLKFYRNNQQLPITINSVRGQVYPLLYVSDNAILDVKFRNTSVSAPHGFEEIMIEQTLL
jgi:hypothetical protein